MAQKHGRQLGNWLQRPDRDQDHLARPQLTERKVRDQGCPET